MPVDYTRMIILILSLIFVIDGFVKDITAFNTFLTYTLRVKKITLYPNITGNISIDYYNYNHYLNGNISMNFNVTPNKITYIFHRCNSEGINCEYFQSWQLTDICLQLKEKNQMWSSLIDSFHPPIECPFKVHYQVRNGTADIIPLIHWYPDVTEYQWKVILNAYFDDLFLGGIKVDVHLFGYKKRIK